MWMTRARSHVAPGSGCVLALLGCLLLLLTSPPAGATLTIFTANSSSGTQNATLYPTFAVMRTVPFENVEAPILMLANPTNKQPLMEDFDISGKIIILERMDVNLFELWALSEPIKAANVSAVVLIDTEVRSLGSLNSEIGYAKKISFPVALIEDMHREALWTLINSTQGPIFARLDSNSLKSAWTEALQSPFFWALICFISMLQIALLILCIGRIIQFARNQYSFTAKVAVAVIFTEIFGAIIRLIYWGIDPFGQRGIFSDAVRKGFHTSPIPFSLIATLFLTLYWHAILKGSQARFSWSMSRFGKPAFLLAGAVLLFEIVVDSLVLSGFILRPLDLVRSIFYLTIATSFMLFFLITGVRVLRTLSKTVEHETSAEAALVSSRHRSFTIKIFSSTMLIIGIIAAGFLTVIPAYSTHWIPAVVITAWAVMHALLTCKAFITVYALLPIASSAQATSPHHHNRRNRVADYRTNALAGTATAASSSSAPLSFTPMITDSQAALSMNTVTHVE